MGTDLRNSEPQLTNREHRIDNGRSDKVWRGLLTVNRWPSLRREQSICPIRDNRRRTVLTCESDFFLNVAVVVIVKLGKLAFVTEQETGKSTLGQTIKRLGKVQDRLWSVGHLGRCRCIDKSRLRERRFSAHQTRHQKRLDSLLAVFGDFNLRLQSFQLGLVGVRLVRLR